MSRSIFLALLILASCSRHPGRQSKIIVLGVDGMDPGFVERHWSNLPNLRRLRARGGFSPLATTTPPQSPVAWSTFITGLDPAEHGIFDFVHRDPATMQPYSSMGRAEQSKWHLPLGPYVLPLSNSRVTSFRHGQAFWQLLADRGIPVTIVRMPTNYPPLKAGQAISGMGTPDLRGSLGTFTFYTDHPEELERGVPGGQVVKCQVRNGRAILRIEGPPNTLRRDRRFETADLIADVDPEQPFVRLTSGGQQAILKQGEWSEWLAADFALIPHVVSVRGTFRVYAKELHPGFQLYVSAINIDPLAPSLPLSTPANLGRDVADETGRFYTLGTPEDTAILRQGLFTLPEFLSQSRLVLEDELRLLRYSLAHFEGGFLFFYFSSIDQNSHMLWKQHDAELLRIYIEVDDAIGEVQRSQPGADLIVMSDHGFTTFERAFHLNAWLRERGFLTLNGPPGDETNLSDIDWSKTQAYALGLNGLYVNLAGREKNGIVRGGARYDALIRNLREQLLAFRDPVNGLAVVEAVERVRPAADNANAAPDLIVGYARGYRASWQTGVGATPRPVIEDNNDAWIGDHCINAADVPGVLFTSRPMKLTHPRLRDVTSLVLAHFVSR